MSLLLLGALTQLPSCCHRSLPDHQVKV
jgi:hypothetical protein